MPATATKSRNARKAAAARFAKSGYDAIRSITGKPLNQRQEIPAGRHGEMVTPRKFHLSTPADVEKGEISEVEALKAEYKENGKGDFVPNPHNRGNYHYIIESLKALGVNRAHSVPVVLAKFRDLTHTAETKDADGKTFWQRWKNKESAAKDETKALNWTGKFEQNTEVLQRVPREGSRNKHPYGLKLKEVGTLVMGTKGVVIDILKGSNGQKMLMLNTNSAFPRNEFRTRGASAEAAATPAAPRKRKAARKATPKATSTAESTTEAREPEAVGAGA